MFCEAHPAYLYLTPHWTHLSLLMCSLQRRDLMDIFVEIVSKFGSNKKKKEERRFGCTKSKLIVSQISCATPRKIQDCHWTLTFAKKLHIGVYI